MSQFPFLALGAPRDADALSAGRDLLAARSVGYELIHAVAHVNEKTTDEFIGIQRHFLALIAMGVVPPLEAKFHFTSSGSFSMPSSPEFTATECDAWIEQFHASALPQSAFCEREGLPSIVSVRHYKRSEKFAGTRREPRSSINKKDEKASAFCAVQHEAAAMLEQLAGENVTIHIGQ